MILLALSASARAFCGLYVTEPGKTVENHASQVILAHHDGQTTLTIAPDFEGDVTTFGMLIPVPERIRANDVSIVDPARLDYLDTYTSPRLVQMECEDAATYADETYHACSLGGGGGRQPFEADGVRVESRFEVGEYEIAVLRSDEADDLTAWLDDNGFVVPEDRDGILQGYLDAGVHLLAVRVDTEPDEASRRAVLPPIQFRYDAEKLTLPIRIGTLSSTGPQEVIVYVITDIEAGEVHVANYPEVEVADDCLWNPASGELSSWYEDRVATAFGDAAGWMVEYSIPVVGVAACDPCTTTPLYVEDLEASGWDAQNGCGSEPSAGAYLTRLRVKYDAATAVDDLEFVTVGAQAMQQMRFIEGGPAWDLNRYFPQCDPADGGKAAYDGPYQECLSPPPAQAGGGGAVCAVLGTPAIGIASILAFAAARRARWNAIL
jgi:hypothetical protein